MTSAKMVRVSDWPVCSFLDDPYSRILSRSSRLYLPFPIATPPLPAYRDLRQMKLRPSSSLLRLRSTYTCPSCLIRAALAARPVRVARTVGGRQLAYWTGAEPKPHKEEEAEKLSSLAELRCEIPDRCWMRISPLLTRTT